MMLLHQNVETFLTVVERGTISAAAEQIGLTQTATTHRIKQLEQEVGTTLFLRSRKGMSLTEEGHEFLRFCLRSKELEGEAIAKITKRGLEHQIDFKISGPSVIIGNRIVFQCQEIYAKWPVLNLSYLVASNAHRLNYLKNGLADMAILVADDVPKELEKKDIKPWEFALVAPYSWKNRKLDTVLKNERICTYHREDDTAEKYFKKFGLKMTNLQRAISVNDNQAKTNLIEQGICYGVLPPELIQRQLKDKTLFLLNRGQTFRVPLCLAWYPRSSPPAYFLELVKSIH